MREDIQDIVKKKIEKKCPLGFFEIYREIFPKDWKIKNLKEIIVGEISNGVFNAPEKQGKGIKIINVGDLYVDGVIDVETLKRIDLDEDIISKNLVKSGDILCTRSSIKKEGIGKCNVYLSDEAVVYDGHVMKFSVDTSVLEPQYVSLFLNTHFAKKQMLTYAKTTTMTTIGQKELGNIKIVFPSLTEQRKIVEIISRYEMFIEIQKKYIEECKIKKMVVAKELFSEKKRKEIKWKTVKMEEIFLERKEINNKDAELLSITAQGIIPRMQIEGKDVSSEDKSKYKKICKGDIGYNTMRMWQGVCAVSNYEGIVSPAYTVLKPMENVDVHFWGHLFKMPSSIFMFYRYSQGLVDDTRNLKYENFKKIKFTIPSQLDEQYKISRLLNASDKEIELLERKISLFQREKRTIMQLLLTGIVRVNDM